MSLRYQELVQIVGELQRLLVGGAVQKAWARGDAAWLDVRYRSSEGWRSAHLVLHRSPTVGRISVAAARPQGGDPPEPFQKWLRQELTGARISAVRLAPDDRIVRIELGTERGARALVLELTGPGSVLALLAAEDRTIAHVGSAGEGRNLRPGQPYAPPVSHASPSQLEQPSRLKPEPDTDFPHASAAEALLGDRERTQTADVARRTLLAPLKAKRARLLRTLEKVRAEASRQEEAEEQRRTGELIAQNLHRLGRGATRVTLTEYTEQGPREVEVALDPSRAPKQEVEVRFHRYRRLMRGCEAAARRQAELGRELSQVEAELARIEAMDAEAIAHAAPATPSRKQKGPQVARPYREFVSAKGERILVGKGSKENDVLTFKVARPHDLWLHVRGVPGSHVVVPLERGREVPQEVLLDAAHLALHYSQQKGEPSGEVSYTHARFVRKQKGAAPGAVTYTREKTFHVRVEPDRIERLLRSRAGDEAVVS